nr:oligosaccharide flippase family protein [Bradyrhizobium ottawaense]
MTTALVQAANLGFGIAAARLLGPVDRGILAYQVTLSTVVATLLSFGIGEAVTYKATTKSTSVHHSSYAALSALYGVVGGLAWLSIYPLASPISSTDQRFAYLTFACYPVLNYLTVSFVGWFAGAGLTNAWNVQRLLVQLAQPCTLAPLLLIGKPSVTLFAISILAAHVSAALIGFCQISVSEFVHRPHWDEMKAIFVIGIQSFGTRVSNLIRDNADKLIVGTLVAPEVLAQYVVAVSFAQIFNAYSQTIVQLYFSRIAETVNTKSKPIEMASTSLLLLGAAGAVLVSAFAGRWLVTSIFGGEFAIAGEMAPLLMIGMVFASIKVLLVAHALAKGQPWITSKVDVYGVLPTLVTIFILVRLMGAWGAAYAFVLSQFLTASVMLAVYWKSYEDKKSMRA